MGDADPEAPVDPRELILQYHKAAQARHAQAQEFLRPSTPTDEKRLVFMHGGTMSVHVSCLSTIMEHETGGDVEEAHATYIRLASNGVAGLSPSTRLSYSRPCSPLPEIAEQDEDPAPAAASSEVQDQQERYVESGDDPVGDRIIRAMRAADALDKETEFLQPVTPDVDLTVKLVDIPSRSRRRLSPAVVEASESLRGSRTPPPRHVLVRPPTDRVPRVSLDAPATEESASAAPRRPALRIRIPSPPPSRSVDAARTADWQPLSKADKPQDSAPSITRHKRSRTAESNLSPTQVPARIEPAQEDIHGLPTPDSEVQAFPQEGSEDPSELDVHQTAEADEELPFEPVLPVLEDLVVYFTPETSTELHDFVFRRLSESSRTPRLSISGSVVHRHDAFHAGETSHLETDEDLEDDGYDTDGVPPWMRNELVHGLPTPNHSPTPLDVVTVAPPALDTRLYSISVGEETAVSIQNYLRSFLGSHFPLPDRRCSAAEGTEFSAEAGLWRALECDGHLASCDGEPRLDLILAVGAESGVKKNRLCEVVGQLDQLGFKTSGLSRSGRLDLRYVFSAIRFRETKC
jgi:hypothetical protein